MFISIEIHFNWKKFHQLRPPGILGTGVESYLFFMELGSTQVITCIKILWMVSEVGCVLYFALTNYLYETIQIHHCDTAMAFFLFNDL